MIAVSDAWKSTQYRFILPETFVEITCGLSDVGAQDSVTITGTNEAVFSNTRGVAGNTRDVTVENCATFEQNLWALDGSKNIFPDDGPHNGKGYVNDQGLQAVLTLSVPELRTIAIPGITITWSSEYGEYPTEFSVVAKNGDTEVATAYITDNTSTVSEINMNLVNYDSITIEVMSWCVPNHRVRIDQVSFGHVVKFTKKDIIGYSHGQYGHLNSGEIPKNSIEFTVDNTDGRWNPSNPSGIEKYLSERQRVTVRYGMDIDGTIEWIDAGTFYLSEWRAPSNGLEASFAARDIFEYMLNEPYTGEKTGTLLQLVNNAFDQVGVPGDFKTVIDPSLGEKTATLLGEYTAAEVVQMCANACCCVFYQDRKGVLHIEPLNKAHTGYTISTALSYTHPEITLSKPLRNVAVSYSEDVYTLNVAATGETQTVDNPFVETEEQAAVIAEWVKETLESRKLVVGEFRADPRLDVFDIVTVESKYGPIVPVAITNILFRYSGSFHAVYEGRVLVGDNQLDSFILDQSTLA